MPLEFRDLTDHEIVAARRIIVESFADEPFARGMFGDSLDDRLAGMGVLWSTWPGDAPGWQVGAFDEGRLIGIASATAPGHCHLCDETEEPLAPDASLGDRIEHEFQRRCRVSHREAALPPHAHIPSVAIASAGRGSGAGALLVGGLLMRVWADGAPSVVLECLSAREGFYSRCGFRRVTAFDDPAAADLISMLMRVDRP